MTEKIDKLITQLEQVLIGKREQICLAVACILARGHLLIEDVPGMGKTSLSHALAKSIGFSYQRIQFTSDMLPADILGVTIFDKRESKFVFHPGPIFKQMVLADEINRASPKTQSALLEAMAEQQITVDGETHELPSPFFVIATQNPIEQSGTFPLPESQLDRFVMRISIGYPDFDSEMAILKGDRMSSCPDKLPQCMTPVELTKLQLTVDEIQVSDAMYRYILDLVEASRNQQDGFGLSPRASKALLQSAKAWALMSNRNYLIPEDVQAVFTSVAQHRIRTSSQIQAETICNTLLSDINPIK